MDDAPLIAYLPIDRAHAAAQVGHAALDGRRRGAVLFADIVGFTPTSLDLTARIGARLGIEELLRRLNGVYDTVVDEVHAHGGAVIEFSGDAVTCWFDDLFPDARGEIGGSGAVARGAPRAAACGLALQRGLSAAVERGDDAFSLKVTVSSGEILRTVVGDPGVRRIDVIAGDPVARTAVMTAQAGEVVCDAETLALLDGSVVADPLTPHDSLPFEVYRLRSTAPATAAWAPAPATSVDEAPFWADHRLRDRELPVTELRPTVSVFVRFDGFADLDEPRFACRLDAYVRGVQHRLAAADGNLLQVTFGDKGNYLYVAFGAPQAHEDLADRAVTAAGELAVGDPAVGVPPTSVGVAHGLSLAGPYGGRARRTYGALGDATNLAARLMMLASGGEVLVTDAVVRAGHGGLRYEPVGERTVKGFAQPVVVARASGQRLLGAAGRDFQAPLVGRASEVATLTAALRNVTVDHGGAVVLVEGEAGIGKSRLIEAVRQRVVADADLRWLSTAAVEKQSMPVEPFVMLLRDVFHLDLGGPEQQRELFDLGIGQIVDQLRTGGATDDADALRAARSFLAALVGIRWAGSRYELTSPAARFDRSVKAIDVLLRAAALCRPVALHLRDVHWLDHESRRLVGLLVETAKTVPLAVVLDGRPTGTAGSGSSLLPPPTLRLGPLDESGVRDQIEALVAGPCGTSVLELVRRRAAGNPFFTEQLVIDLRERGLLVSQGDHVELSGAVSDELPVTLQSTLLSRIDRLPEPVRDLIQAAAVLGERFDVALLAAVAQRIPTEPGFAELVDAGVAHTIWRTLDGARLEFVHGLLRDTVYAMQPERRLRARHRAAADALRLLHRHDDRRAAEVAAHYRRAGDTWRAAVFLRRAARAAGSANVYREASACALQALDLLEKTAGSRTRARLSAVAGEMALAGGSPRAAAGYFQRARSLADGDRDAVRWLCGLGDAAERLGQTAEATEAYEAALELIADEGAVELAARIYVGLSRLQLGSGDSQAGAELGELALALATTLGDPYSIAAARNTLACHHLAGSDYSAAKLHATIAADVAGVNGDPLSVGAAANTLGLVALADEELPAAIAEFRRARHAFRLSGNEAGEARALDNLAGALVRDGQRDLGMATLAEAVEILARIGLDGDDIESALWRSGIW